MTAHAPAQYTTAQILEAARRAEAEGRLEFAHQFYRHLAEQHPASPEAGLARDGMSRLQHIFGPDRPAREAPLFDLSTPRRAPPPLAAATAPAYPSAPSPQGLPVATPLAREPAFDDYPQRQNAVQPAAVVTRSEIPFEPPPLRKDYRTARLIARLLTWIGGIAVLAGLAALPVSILSPRSLQAVPLIGAWFGGVTFGAGIVAGGLAQMVVGQLLRALLDQANATRDIAALARAKAEHDAGPDPERARSGSRRR